MRDQSGHELELFIELRYLGKTGLQQKLQADEVYFNGPKVQI